MKYRLILLFLILPFFVNAQKATYIKNRFTCDVSYIRMRHYIIPANETKQNGVSISANYGLTKFLESGLYYYKYNTTFTSVNFAGIQNRFHILPFFNVSNNKFFRLDAYVFNQTGLAVYKHVNDFITYCNTDIGLGTSLFLFKNVGINFEYKWGFLLSKTVENYNFQNGLKLGLILKF